MRLGIFRKLYTVRWHEKQTVKRGYASSPYADVKMRLNIQPQAPNSLDSRVEGDITVKHLKAWGKDKLTSADENTGIPGDCLYYQGAWYECKSSAMWNYTPLAHYQSDFVIMLAEKQFPPPGSNCTIPAPSESEAP